MNIEVDVRFGGPTSPRRAAKLGPMRLLLLGDFGGRGNASAPGAPAVRRVDLDTLESVLAGIAPQLQLATAEGAATRVQFSSLDDFHPDRLFERVPVFGRLRTLRARLLQPATFEEAATELRAHGLVHGETGQAASVAAAADAESDSGTLQRLLGGRPAAPPEAAPARASPVDALIRRVIAPHIAPGSTPHLSVYLAAVDEAIGGQMRQLLHAPALRELEAVWRGAQWLVSRLELNEDLQLYLLDVTRAELMTDLLAGKRDPSASELARALRAAGTEETGYWALLAGLFSVGPTAEDLNLLAALGAVASKVAAPVIAAAAPALFGCHAVADLTDPRRWQPLPAEPSGLWAALRGGALAPWIGLVVPRILLRRPYGKSTDPLEQFAFEEQPADPDHETLLWGPGSLAVALLLGRAFAEGGWEQVAHAAPDLDDLPAYTFHRDGEMQLQPCAEAWVGARAGRALLDHGVMPLLSERHAARVRLMQMQSVAAPAQPLAGRWL